MPSLTENIAPRTLAVALILLGLIASIPPPEPVAAPLDSAAFAPWNTSGGVLRAADGQRPNLRSAHNTPLLTVQPDPAPRVDLRLLISWEFSPS